MKRVMNWMKSEFVLTAALLAAVVSSFFVPFSLGCLIEAVDFGVLTLLFCLMLVVACFEKTNAFAVLAQKMLKNVRSVRTLSLLLTGLCFFSSMLVTNDVALITFVPLTIGIFSAVGRSEMIFVLVSETAAANLGSMLTPVGNPQNLYLYSFYKLTPSEFFSATVPVVVFSAVCIALMIVLKKNRSIQTDFRADSGLKSRKKLYLYICLFAVILLAVFRLVPCLPVLAVVLSAVLISDRKCLLKVDYSLLLTFICFFIFVGNLEKIEPFRLCVSGLLEKNPFLVSVLLSQVISNVPAAVMLSSFTHSARALLLGVNAGGLGTPIASLASLITLRLYLKSPGADGKKFMLSFLLINTLLLFALILFICLFLL